jgi:2-methylisocitrate lyase-like PEP mutase family enzyme
MGFAVVLAPITTLLSATKAMQDSLADLHELGFRSDRLATMTSYDDFLRLVGIDEIDEQEQRYS